MRIAILELALILELGREQQPVALSPGQTGDVVADGAVVEDVVGVEYERVGGIYVVLVDVCGDDYGCALYAGVFYVEEAVAQRSIAGHIPKKVQIVLGRLEPPQVCSPAIDDVQSLFWIGWEVLMRSKSAWWAGAILMLLVMGLKVDMMGSNYPMSLGSM